MKFAFFILLFSSFISLAQAKDCEVYGISDSPQKLDCRLGDRTINLRCQDGTYVLDGEVVEMAYHEEVEDGPVPMIFKTAQTKLMVLLHSPRKIEAQFSQNQRLFKGPCQL